MVKIVFCDIHSVIAKFRILKALKDSKTQELSSFSKLVTEDLIFRSNVSQMFSKMGVLKSFAIFTGKHLVWPLQASCKRLQSPSFTKHLRLLFLDFHSRKCFFQLTAVFIADSHTGFSSKLLWS